MGILILIIALFIPSIAFPQTFDIEKHDIQHEKAFIPLLAWAIGAAILSIAVGVYTYMQIRKMQKKNQLKPSQLTGSISDAGVSFTDVAGSPHMYGNITYIGQKSTIAIREKGGKK